MMYLNLLFLAFTCTRAYPKPEKPQGALYFLDSDPHRASVVSLPMSTDGSLGKPIRTSTDGKGLIGVNANGSVAVGKFQKSNK